MQVVEHDSRVPMPRVKDAHARAILEGQLGRLLSHPNVVAGFGTFSGTFPHGRLCIPGSASVASRPDRNVTLLLQELCGRGTLRAALQSGALYEGADAAAAASEDAADEGVGTPLPRLKVLAQAARQVAFGLSHMHAYHVVHCDLNASNVFLQAAAPESCVEGTPRLDVYPIAYCMRAFEHSWGTRVRVRRAAHAGACDRPQQELSYPCVTPCVTPFATPSTWQRLLKPSWTPSTTTLRTGCRWRPRACLVVCRPCGTPHSMHAFTRRAVARDI